MSSQSYLFNPTERTLAAAGDGFSAPRLTTADRLALSLGVNGKGMMVYDTTLTTLCLWNGAAWEFINDNSSAIVSVKDFGAKGDGVTDDTAAIQAAINYGRTDSKRIYVPAGTYIVSSTLTYASSGSGGILIDGTTAHDINANTGSVFKYTGTGSCFKFTGAPVFSIISNITFLGVDGNGAIGLDIDFAWYITIEKCVFKYFRAASSGAGIKIGYTAPGYFAGVTTIRDCYISENYIGIWSNSMDINVLRVDTCTIFINKIGFQQGNGLTATSSNNFNFNNCLFEGNVVHDILSYGGATNWNVIGCYFEQGDITNNLPRIKLDQFAGVKNLDVSIIGNTFGKQLQAAGQSLVYVKAVDGLIFKNNNSVYGDAVDRYSIFADACTNTELWLMSTLIAVASYPINDNGTIRTTGSVYKTGTIAISGGIEFPATQAPSANPNTLDDYEEGTFLATLKGGTTDPTTPVTTTGRYTKIGREVKVSFFFNNVNTTGASGLINVVGLPFLSANDGVGSWGVFSTHQAAVFTGYTVCEVGPNTVQMQFPWYQSAGISGYSTHSAGAGRYIGATIMYNV